MQKIQVKMVICRDHMKQHIPEYKTELSSGCDLRAAEETTIVGGRATIVPTGIKMALPDGYEAQVRNRSGASLKGINGTDGKTHYCLVSFGTIDADYRGEVGIIVYPLDGFSFVVPQYERIAQMVFASVVQAEFTLVEHLDDTERGEGGFGHSGTK